MGPLGQAAQCLYQSIGSLWAGLRHGPAFEDVERFCLFVGYPRSGHSLVGAMLNAHRDAVIAHELNASEHILAGCTRNQLYARILARASWFHLRRNTSNYPYQIPGQWQGRYRKLRIMGDKRGGAVSRCLVDHPDFLERLRALVGVPLRLIHVVRNPFDNISAIAIWNRMSLEESSDFYFRHCDVTANLGQYCQASELITIHHEAMIQEPAAVLKKLCAFLELERYPGYLEDCSSVVFHKPTYSRQRLSWPAALIRAVEKRANAFPFLNAYGFELPG